jgi:MATE family multidrug resistance protein
MAEILTHKRVLQFSLPIVLSNATVPILGAVDTGVVGQLGEAAPIGAVGIGAIILTAFYWIFGFLRMGTAGLTAQAKGAKDDGEVAALLSRALLIGVAAGAFFIIAQVVLFWMAFKLSPASAKVEGLARQYMAIRVWSAPAAIALYGITGWLVALERTGAILAIQLLMNVLNIVLDLVSGLVLGLWLCRAAFAGPAWRDWARVFDRVRLRHMALVNGDIMIRSVLLQAIFVSFLFWGADFGDVNLAANQILLQFLFATSFALDGFAFAAEAMVGQALGARNRAALRRAALLTSMWGLAICMALALCFALIGGVVIDVMTTSHEVRDAGRVFLPYMVVAPLVGVAAWMLDGIYIGATRTVDMRNMMLISAEIYFITVPFLMAWLGNHGLWLALLISFAVRGITLALRYPRLEAEADRV